MRKIFLLFCTLFLCSAAVFAASSDTSSGHIAILSATDLAHIKEPISILDVRSAPTFREGRIPGSQHVDWKRWAQERADVIGQWFGKPAKSGLVKITDDKFQDELRQLGLSNSKLIVVVGEPGGWGEDGRIAWILLYWGADNVALLNGGYAAWAALPNMKPETSRIQKPLRGDFVIRLRAERRADLAQVKKAVADKWPEIIDNRSAEEFSGKILVGQTRGGHIPGARSVPVDKLYQASGLYVDKAELTFLLPLDQKVNPIAYCAGGVRSALFAMLWEAYNGEMVANYDGSMWEWSAQTDTPLE